MDSVRISHNLGKGSVFSLALNKFSYSIREQLVLTIPKELSLEDLGMASSPLTNHKTTFNATIDDSMYMGKRKSELSYMRLKCKWTGFVRNWRNQAFKGKHFRVEICNKFWCHWAQLEAAVFHSGTGPNLVWILVVTNEMMLSYSPHPEHVFQVCIGRTGTSLDKHFIFQLDNLFVCMSYGVVDT